MVLLLQLLLLELELIGHRHCRHLCRCSSLQLLSCTEARHDTWVKCTPNGKPVVALVPPYPPFGTQPNTTARSLLLLLLLLPLLLLLQHDLLLLLLLLLQHQLLLLLLLLSAHLLSQLLPRLRHALRHSTWSVHAPSTPAHDAGRRGTALLLLLLLLL